MKKQEKLEERMDALLLHEGAITPLADVALPAAGEVLLVVGPEGGIAEAVQSVTDLAGAFSWLVAGSIGYYFGSSR